MAEENLAVNFFIALESVVLWDLHSTDIHGFPSRTTQKSTSFFSFVRI